MAASYLIDGYNLIHAMAVLPARTGPKGLEKARLGLLGLLHGTFGPESSALTVVFDASGAPPGALAEQNYLGIHVRFALGKLEADDVIEELINQCSAPRQLHVVSNDHRLQQATRRRQAQVISCEDFLDMLQKRRQSSPPAPPSPEKTETMTPEEKRRWLEVFGDLDDDLKEINWW